MWPRGHRASLQMDVLMQINEDGDRCRTVSPPGADGSLGTPETPESLLPWVEGYLPWKMGNAIRRKYQGSNHRPIHEDHFQLIYGTLFYLANFQRYLSLRGSGSPPVSGQKGSRSFPGRPLHLLELLRARSCFGGD
ncbi:uncharacterized protein LOC114675786 [Macaca mulatta]